MKKFYILLLFVTTQFISCDTTEPGGDLPGRRDYAWKEDTIKIPDGYYFSLYREWGSSPSDLWAVGKAYSVVHTMWHYDGNSWKTDSVFRNIDPGGLYGFSYDNLWMASTNDGSFWHYDGSDWSKFSDSKIPGYRPVVIENIWGSSPNDIYAVGFADNLDLSSYKAVIMHFDGNKWNLIDIPDIITIFVNIRYSESSNKYLISAYSQADTVNPYRLYTFDGKKVSEIFASNSESVTVYNMNGQAYIEIGKKIYKYISDKLELWKSFEGTKYMVGLYGRNQEDFFTINEDGMGHYNGTDLRTIYPIGFPQGNNAITFPNQVFYFRRVSDRITVIIHGTLK